MMIMNSLHSLFLQYIITTMIGVTILVFEILMIILFGIFLRTDSTATSSLTALDSALYFMLGYAIIKLRHKSLDWTAITTLIYIITITMQINLLYYFFWSEAFAQEFTSSASITSASLISGVEAALAVVVTVFQFINYLSHLQIFIITMIEVFVYALNWGICRWGIQALTGGGGMTIWLFGLLFACGIKKFYLPDIKQQDSTRYFTKTLQLIGLIVVVISWPSFNSLTAASDTSVTNIDSGALLQQQAYLQTFLALVSCIATSLSLRIMGEKIILNRFVHSILMTGILISSPASQIIDPFAPLLLGMVGPILCFLYDRYAETLKKTAYPFDGIFMAILSGILSAICCAGRNGRTPALSSDPFRQGGLQIACMLVCAGFAILFGILTGLILRLTGTNSLENNDISMWQMEPEMMPLYSDDPKLQSLYKKQDMERLQQQQITFSLKQRYLSSKVKQARQDSGLGKILKQSLDNTSKLAN